MRSSKAWRQVHGWIDFYALDASSFARLVASFGNASVESVALALVGESRPPFVVARAIEDVTGVDAHDWFNDERPSASDDAPPESRPSRDLIAGDGADSDADADALDVVHADAKEASASILVA